MGIIVEAIDEIVDDLCCVLESVFGNPKKSNNQMYIPPTYTNTYTLPPIFSNVISTVGKSIGEAVIQSLPIEVIEEVQEEESEYNTYEGDVSEYPSERLETDGSNLAFIRIKESGDEDNVFGNTLFNFRKNGPKFGCDIRLEPYYKIPEKFYSDKWGEEILTFTDVLAGYIPLVKKIRNVVGDPTLYFGVRIYNNPDSFMLSSLNGNNKMTDNVLITVSNEKYEIAIKKDAI